MTIDDGPAGRMPETGMRDLLRWLERQATAHEPVRPPHPDAAQTQLNASHSHTQQGVAVGGWRLLADDDTGDLIAEHDDGTRTTLARKGPR